MINKTALVPAIGALVSPFSASASESGPLLIAFGQSGAKKNEYRSKYYDNRDAVWNILSTPADSEREVCFDKLRFGDNRAAKGVSAALSQPTSGTGACIRTFAGDTAMLDSYLDTSVVYGCNCADGGVEINLAGLSVGTYTLLVLAARGNGNANCADEVSYGISGDNVAVAAASVLTSAQTEGVNVPFVQTDNTILATTHRKGRKNNQADNWVLMKFCVVVGDTGALMIKAAGGSGNIAALMLIPDPGEAWLGLLSAFSMLRSGE